MRRIRVPKARATDPDTSWEAARGISAVQLRQSQALVLSMFVKHGAMNDEELQHRLEKSGIVMSDSGARTRRKELVDAGYLRDSGKRALNQAGNRTVVWELDE